jgi:hypothetical protein
MKRLYRPRLKHSLQKPIITVTKKAIVQAEA